MERAYFAAGCFWGVEETFRKVPGTTTSVGYMGGNTDGPTYKDVCTGRTGHAETVEVVFDPDVVSYDELLNVFWRSHDPTTRDRQGPDVGSQYRSAIFYVGEAQRDAALASRERVSSSLGGRVVTEVSPAGTFWRAEEYHQGYVRRRSRLSRRP